MNTILLIGYEITIGIPEMIIFFLAAIVLGFSIHFFWKGRHTVSVIENSLSLNPNAMTEDDAQRLSHYEQIEQYERKTEKMEREINGMREAEKKLLAELEEAREEVERLERLI